MPYRRRGRRVEKKKNGKWVLEKKHPSAQKAQDHLKALKANVEDA